MLEKYSTQNCYQITSSFHDTLPEIGKAAETAHSKGSTLSKAFCSDKYMNDGLLIAKYHRITADEFQWTLYKAQMPL